MTERDDQIRNESRLAVLETRQQKILETTQQIEKNQKEIYKEISDIKLTFSRMGGILIGFTMVGAGIGWLLTNIKNFLGLTG